MLTCGQINDLIYLKHEIGNLFIKSLTEKKAVFKNNSRKNVIIHPKYTFFVKMLVVESFTKLQKPSFEKKFYFQVLLFENE